MLTRLSLCRSSLSIELCLLISLQVMPCELALRSCVVVATGATSYSCSRFLSQTLAKLCFYCCIGAVFVFRWEEVGELDSGSFSPPPISNLRSALV